MGFTLPPPPTDVAQALIARKDAIQAELDGQFAILSANNSTLRTPLVDPQGFPRADIDVWAVRHARVRIIELRNDMEKVMDDIGKALEGVYDPRIGGNVTEDAPLDRTFAIGEASEERKKAFARVDGVAPGSPAAQAGVQRDDLILQFGPLTIASFPTQTLQPVAAFVASHENQSLDVLVLGNDTQQRTLHLTPRKGWGGRGLLGCHIVPCAPSESGQ